MATTKNPESKPINQKQGPRHGNTGTPAKRAEFSAAKSKTSSERSKIAEFIMNAFAGRGAGMQGKVDPTVEGISSNTGPKSNPTAGGTKYKTTGRK